MGTVTLTYIEWLIIHQIDKLGEGTVSTIGETTLFEIEKESNFPRSELHQLIEGLQNSGFVQSEKRVDPNSSENVEVTYYSLTQKARVLIVRTGKQLSLYLS